MIRLWKSALKSRKTHCPQNLSGDILSDIMISAEYSQGQSEHGIQCCLSALSYDARGRNRNGNYCGGSQSVRHTHITETDGATGQKDTPTDGRQATTDLWSSRWSHESRFPQSWRRGRCTVLLTAGSLLAEIRLLPGKYRKDKLRSGGVEIDRVHTYNRWIDTCWIWNKIKCIFTDWSNQVN